MNSRDHKNINHHELKDDLPVGFKAAMRFNAMQRGMSWKDSYKLTSDLQNH